MHHPTCAVAWGDAGRLQPKTNGTQCLPLGSSQDTPEVLKALLPQVQAQTQVKRLHLGRGGTKEAGGLVRRTSSGRPVTGDSVSA